MIKTKRKPKPKTSNTNGMVVWGVPPKLRADFKSSCANKCIPMRAAILKLMAEFISR